MIASEQIHDATGIAIGSMMQHIRRVQLHTLGGAVIHVLAA
jgi:hypothetical protein